MAMPTRMGGPPEGGWCVLPTPGRAGVSTPRLVMKALADAILKLGQQLGQRIGNLETRATNVEATQTVIIDTLTAMRQEIQDGFTAQREQINELTARVVKLEGGIPPTAKES